MNRWISKLSPHWRFIAFEFCILIGGLLILPAFRLIPFIMDSVLMKPNKTVQTSRIPVDPDSPFSASDPGFSQFIPYFNQGEGEGAVKNIEGEINTPPFFEQLDFSPVAGQMTLRIFPDGDAFYPNQPVNVSFIPGNRCVFGDGQACIYRFTTSGEGRVVFASVHSGLGAEAEKFRDLIEGTGINRALYGQERVRKHMQALAGARVAVSQGETQIDGLTLSTIVRIPPEQMAAYMQTPVEAVLNFAVEIGGLDPDFLSQDLLVFETCGWRLPGEALVPGAADTSTSVYLGMIVLPEP